MKIKVPAAELARFRRRAAAKYPREYVEILWGRVSADCYEIVRFVVPPQRGKRDSVEYGAKYPPDPGLVYLGNIHSHCDAMPVPSEADNETARDGEKIIGILSISKNGKAGRRRHELKWWFVQYPATDVEIC